MVRDFIPHRSLTLDLREKDVLDWDQYTLICPAGRVFVRTGELYHHYLVYFQQVVIYDCLPKIHNLCRWHDRGYVINYSHDPLLDLVYLNDRGYEKMLALGFSLTIGQAYHLVKEISTDQENQGVPQTSCKPYRNSFSAVAKKKRALRKAAARINLAGKIQERPVIDGGKNKKYFPRPLIWTESKGVGRKDALSSGN